MSNMKFITINKNRGWRGLAEIAVLNEDKDLVKKHIFSFSQAMWDDMIYKNMVVIRDSENYYVIHFSSVVRGMLPRPVQQRSVLIKNFTAEIDRVNQVPVNEWTKETGEMWETIRHFIKNRNNHTQSDWNCIGIRVTPSI